MLSIKMSLRGQESMTVSILDKKVRDHEFQPKCSSQIWHDNDFFFSIFTLVKTPLATIEAKFDIFT